MIVGNNGGVLSIPLTAQNNPNPSVEPQTYRFRVHAKAEWNPGLREVDFIGTLSNVTSIRVRGTYSRGGGSIYTSIYTNCIRINKTIIKYDLLVYEK